MKNKLMLTLLSGVLLASSLNIFKAEAATSFKDVAKSHWAYSSITSAVNKGYFKGYTNGTFKPSASVTRAEFAALLSRVSKEKPETEKSNVFTDVKGHWSQKEVDRAVSLGFINPNDYKNGFKPNTPLTRQEMAKWLSSGLAAHDEGFNQALKDTKTTVLPVREYFKNQISQTQAPYIAVVMGTGLMNGYTDGTFGLKKTTTRAEVSAILLRFERVSAKSASEFADLVELRAVGTLDSNIELMTPFTSGDSGLSRMSGKRYTFKNGSGSLVFHRAIALNPLASENKQSLYTDVFFTDEELKRVRKGSYPIYSQITVYPTASNFKLDHYKNSQGSYLLIGSRIPNSNPNKFGYITLPGVNTQEFFSKNKNGVTMWVQSYFNSETLPSTRMDDRTIVRLSEK